MRNLLSIDALPTIRSAGNRINAQIVKIMKMLQIGNNIQHTVSFMRPFF